MMSARCIFVSRTLFHTMSAITNNNIFDTRKPSSFAIQKNLITTVINAKVGTPQHVTVIANVVTF